jgi:hypothetical protein
MKSRNHNIIWNNCHRPISSKNIWERGLDKKEVLSSDLNTGKHTLHLRKFCIDKVKRLIWGWAFNIRQREDNLQNIGETIKSTEWMFKDRNEMTVQEAERKALKYYKDKY